MLLWDIIGYNSYSLSILEYKFTSNPDMKKRKKMYLKKLDFDLIDL